MDSTDRRILYELDLGSRKPLSQIASKLKLSKRVVSYRVDKLIEQNIIERFITILNTAKLGFTDYKLFIRLSNVSSKDEPKILSYLVNHPYVQWVVFCQGNYDLILAVYGRNIMHFYEVFSELQREIGNYISHKDLSITAGLYNFRRSYLIGTSRKGAEFTYYGEEPGKANLDETDAKILSVLSQNSRMPTVEIARESGLSVEIIKYRLKKLQKQDILQGFRPRINTPELGLQYYKILLFLKNQTEEVEQKLISYMGEFPNIVYATKCVAPWDFEFEAEVESPTKLQEMLSSLRDKFSDNIVDYHTILMLKEYKFDYFPMKGRYFSSKQ